MYRKILIFRALVGFLGIQGKMNSVKYMPVSTSSCIFFTVPIWSSIFAYFILSEKITKWDIMQLSCSFIGCLLINDPFAENSLNSKYTN